MSNTAEEILSHLVNEITLDSVYKNDIICKINTFKNLLLENPPAGYEIEDIRLSGSFAKNIEINEYIPNTNPDVDIVVILKINRTLNARETFDDFYKFLDSQKGSVANVRKQSNSIRVNYKNIDVDIVIGAYKDKQLKIVSNKRNGWIDSNCLRQVTASNVRSQLSTYNYRGLMKIMKYINKYLIDPRYKLKSYTLEMLVYWCAPRDTCYSLNDALRTTLHNVSDMNDINGIKDAVEPINKGFDDKDIPRFSYFTQSIEEFLYLYERTLINDQGSLDRLFPIPAV